MNLYDLFSGNCFQYLLRELYPILSWSTYYCRSMKISFIRFIFKCIINIIFEFYNSNLVERQRPKDVCRQCDNLMGVHKDYI